MSTPTLDRTEWLVRKGRKAFRDGKPVPPRPADDDDKSDVFFLWAGYLLERAKDYFKRRDVENALRPDPDDPRPRKAA